MADKRHMSFNDGIAYIYRVVNAAEDGDRPKEALELKRLTRYKSMTLGIGRYYTALQAQIKLSAVLSIPYMAEVTSQDIVIIGGSEGQYRISQVQHKNDTYPPTTQLSLTAIEEKKYDFTGL